MPDFANHGSRAINRGMKYEEGENQILRGEVVATAQGLLPPDRTITPPDAPMRQLIFLDS